MIACVKGVLGDGADSSPYQPADVVPRVNNGKQCAPMASSDRLDHQLRHNRRPRAAERTCHRDCAGCTRTQLRFPTDALIREAWGPRKSSTNCESFDAGLPCLVANQHRNTCTRMRLTIHVCTTAHKPAQPYSHAARLSASPGDCSTAFAVASLNWTMCSRSCYHVTCTLQRPGGRAGATASMAETTSVAICQTGAYKRVSSVATNAPSAAPVRTTPSRHLLDAIAVMCAIVARGSWTLPHHNHTPRADIAALRAYSTQASVDSELLRSSRGCKCWAVCGTSKQGCPCTFALNVPTSGSSRVAD